MNSKHTGVTHAALLTFAIDAVKAATMEDPVGSPSFAWLALLGKHLHRSLRAPASQHESELREAYEAGREAERASQRDRVFAHGAEPVDVGPAMRVLAVAS
jgi:hypothetical protein